MKLRSLIMVPSRFRPLITAALLGSLFAITPAAGQSRDVCLACHSDESLTTERNGKQVSLYVKDETLQRSPHAKLPCVACHTKFDPENVPHKDPMTPVNCLTCHASAPPKHRFHPQLAAANGTNGKPGMSCKGCHGTHDIVRPLSVGGKFASDRQAASCGQCHSTEKEKFTASAHGHALDAKVQGAPTCLACHQRDITKVRPGRDSVAVKLAQEQLCLACHKDNPDVRARTAPSAGFIAAYGTSVHGRALETGNASAANCVNCHGSHTVNKGSDAHSSMNRSNIVATCSRCHTGVGEVFEQSVHGVAARSGNPDAPVCTGCHGEHTILKHTDPASPVAAKNVSAQVCSPCHGSVRLSEKYGISGDRFKTFTDSYHGLAIQGGAVGVANCASCHGSHNIKPSSDPTSMVNKANLAHTCGRCHPGANERFGEGAVHVTTTTTSTDPVISWISTLYVWIIIGTIGGMFVHNLADFIRKARRKLLIRRGVIVDHHTGHRLYLRMSFNERLQHGTLLVSFLLLVLTGFMLRYPNAWWVAGLRNLSAGVFDVRSLLHRVAAVGLVGASLYHIYYLMFTERGRGLFRDLMPRVQDARDMMAQLRYNFGFSSDRPQFGRFSYIEKSEYWALVWGTVVMSATGVIMWFDNTFIGLLSKLGYDVARTIHFYEAWLATLAIVVWHFYYVIFNPDAYPINLAFLKGTISESEMVEDHPLELAEIRRREGGDLDRPNEDEPASDDVRRR